MDIDTIKSELSLIGTAIIRRDGTLEEDSLPPDLNRETFSIMCATIYGAAVTAANEIRFRNPTRIVVNGPSGVLLLIPYKERHFIVSIVSPDKSLDDVINYFNTELAKE